MNLTIKQAIKIYSSRKDFLIYTKDENNNLINYTLTNDLTRHRKAFGINTKFLLTEVIKQQIKILNIKL